MASAPFQFLNPGLLYDGELELVLLETQDAVSSVWKVPAYIFQMPCYESREVMGRASLRIGTGGIVAFAGQIGYFVGEQFRGNRYAERSCRLLLPLAARHGLRELLITCQPDNAASLRTLERLGAEPIDVVDVPPDYPLPDGAVRKKCRFRLAVGHSREGKM